MPVEQREQVTHVRWSQRVTGGTPCLDGRRQPSLGGTSRMNREVHVRICGRLGVKFPGPTRQTAMKLVLEPIFEADFHDCSYGYRPRRDAKMASKAIRNDLYRGAWSVVEIDFRSYFTTIPHDKLMILIKQRVVDGSLLRLIKQSLGRAVGSDGEG